MLGLYMASLKGFLGACLGWVVGIYLGTNGWFEIGFWDSRLIGTILGAVDGFPLVTCDGTLLGSLEDLIDGDEVDKCLCLCCCRGYF